MKIPVRMQRCIEELLDELLKMLAKKPKRRTPTKKPRAQVEAALPKPPPRKPRYKPGVAPRRKPKPALTLRQTAVLHILKTMDPEPQTSWNIAALLRRAESTCRYHLGKLVEKGLATTVKHGHQVLYLPT